MDGKTAVRERMWASSSSFPKASVSGDTKTQVWRFFLPTVLLFPSFFLPVRFHQFFLFCSLSCFPLPPFSFLTSFFLCSLSFILFFLLLCPLLSLFPFLLIFSSSHFICFLYSSPFSLSFFSLLSFFFYTFILSVFSFSCPSPLLKSKRGVLNLKTRPAVFSNIFILGALGNNSRVINTSGVNVALR